MEFLNTVLKSSLIQYTGTKQNTCQHLYWRALGEKQPTVALQYHNVNGQFSLCGGLKISTLPTGLKSLPSLFVSFVSLWNYDGCANVITHLVTFSKRITTVAEVKWFTMQPAASKMLSFQETANVNHRILITHHENLPARRLPFTAGTQTGLSLTLTEGSLGVEWQNILFLHVLVRQSHQK